MDSLGDKKIGFEKSLEEYNSRNENLETLSSETRIKLLTAIDELNETVNKCQLDSERAASIDENIQRLKDEISSLTEKLNIEKKTEQQYIEKAEIDKALSDAAGVLREKRRALQRCGKRAFCFDRANRKI